MKKRKNLLLLFIVLMISVLIQGQGGGSVLHNIGSPSPTAASLAKYAANPVNLYTGAHSIHIPLWEVQTRKLQMPVSLSYHGSGIKVNELPGWTGSGWTLNAGGVITRTVRGNYDDNPVDGYFEVYSTYPFGQMDLGAPESWDFLYDAADGKYDTEPDMFSFNLNGRAGQFVMEPVHKTPVPLPDQNIQITPHFGADQIEGWTVIDESGTIYKFFAKETLIQNIKENGGTETQLTYTSSWYLSEMVSPFGVDTIRFTYRSVLSRYSTMDSYELYYPENDTCESKEAYTESDIEAQTLLPEEIRYNDHRIRFYSRLGREDMTDTTGAVLDSLKIFYGAPERHLKTVKFSYSYLNHRLTLMSVQEFGEDETAKKGPYQFTYYEGLPPVSSPERDYWGYYNASGDPGWSLPEIKIGSMFYLNSKMFPNASVARAGMLSGVEYPTGGMTQFEYEAHDYGYIGSGQGQIGDAVEIKSSGIRLPAGSVSPVRSSPKDLQINHTQDVYIFPNINNADTKVKGYLLKYDESAPDNYLTIETFYPTDDGPRLIRLTSGSYVIKLEPFIPMDPEGTPNAHDATIDMEYTNMLFGKYYRYTGGARIKKIMDKTSPRDPGMVKTYHYREQNDPDRSSGMLVSRLPAFHYDKIEDNCIFNVESTVPLKQMVYSQGSPVVYPEVTIIYGDTAGNYLGKEVIAHTSNFDYPDADFFYMSFPYPPYIHTEWKKGKVKESTVYGKEGTWPKERQLYTYKDTLYRITIPGLKAAFSEKSGGGPRDPRDNEITHARYTIETGRNVPATSTSISYFPHAGQTDSTCAVREITYHPGHLQVSKEKTWNSDGTVTETTYTYPFDYPVLANTSNDVLESMRSKHMVNALLQVEENVRFADNSLKNRGATITNYKYNQEKIIPASLETRNVLTGLYEVQTVFDQYDGQNNLLEFHKAGGISGSVIYGYHSRYQVIKAANVSQAALQTAVTAALAQVNPSYSLDDLLEAVGNMTGSSAKTDWNTFNEYLRNTPSLSGANVVTYTYDPAYGHLTSTTGPNGFATYYEYDMLGRLKRIKDHEGNILEQTEYHSHGQ